MTATALHPCHACPAGWQPVGAGHRRPRRDSAGDHSAPVAIVGRVERDSAAHERDWEVSEEPASLNRDAGASDYSVAGDTSVIERQLDRRGVEEAAVPDAAGPGEAVRRGRSPDVF